MSTDPRPADDAPAAVPPEMPPLYAVARANATWWRWKGYLPPYAFTDVAHAERFAEPGDSVVELVPASRLSALSSERGRLAAEVERLRTAFSRSNEEISQTLGRALGYPRFADDQKNFPGATDADGVCVGDHVAETLAMEAAERFKGELVASRREATLRGEGRHALAEDKGAAAGILRRAARLARESKGGTDG